MEVTYVEGDGSDHMSTGVEFEQTAIVNHHQAMREIQELRITTDQTMETTVIEVKNPDKGKFYYAFKNPRTGGYESVKMSCFDKPITIERATRRFYRRYFGSVARVTRKDYDADGKNPRTTKKPIETIRYTIKVVRLISSPTTKHMIISKAGTKATITAYTPAEVQLSAPPIGGKFDVICVNSLGQESRAKNINA